MAWPLRPLALAWYIAVSAACRRAAASAPVAGPGTGRDAVQCGDADADGDPHAHAADVHRRGQARFDAAGQVGGLGQVDPFGDDHELVTAEPGHRVAVAHLLDEPGRDHPQHLVARRRARARRSRP